MKYKLPCKLEFIFQAPMNDCWQNIIVGMKVEVENRDTNHSGVFSNSFWVASVLRISGYYAHLRYEGNHTFKSQKW